VKGRDLGIRKEKEPNISARKMKFRIISWMSSWAVCWDMTSRILVYSWSWSLDPQGRLLELPWRGR